MATFIKIKSICQYITKEACTTLVIMLCMSHLNYSNALLYGLPKKTIKRYQVIQNMCAKLVLGRSKYSTSSEALKCLHWLPIQWRITYKIGLHLNASTRQPQDTFRSSSPSESQHEITCDQTPLALYWKYQKSNIKHLL